MVPERAVRREDCAGKPGLRGHVATCCIRLHDATGAARSHVGVDKREVGCKGEEGVDPPGVAPLNWCLYADCQPRLPIPVFRNLFVGLKKTFLPGFLRISFFPVFSGGIFHRNVVFERSQEFCFFRFYGIFLLEFLWDRNSCIYPAPPPSTHLRLILREQKLFPP